MAQKRFTTYRAAVESFPLGEQHIGILIPARYKGYDSMTTPDNKDIIISHSDIIRKTDNQGETVDNYGVLLMPTGIVIHEEGSISITMPNDTQPGPTDSKIKKFLLVCEHNYQQVVGGVEASYFFIASNSFGESVPNLSDNTKQIAVGIITKNYTENSLSYEPIKTPLIGDTTNQDLYNRIKDFINIPDVPEIPNIGEIVKNIIQKNRSRIIVSPIFDIGEASSLNTWTSIPYLSEPVLNTSTGHNIPKHDVYIRHTVIGDNKAYVDVEITRQGSITSSDIVWDWDYADLISISLINSPDKGNALWTPIEILGGNISGKRNTNSVVKRFQLYEGGNFVQDLRIRLVIQNKIIST
ncbi:MAG: hypothetical protein CL596_04905 [Alteromonas sp.]|nr:hypothetical protein [Alteromonas sp.]|tara:strand:+ start:22257 stop:23318 length:1062 start_codon:yes stop_codon:yes gene_type:complete